MAADLVTVRQERRGAAGRVAFVTLNRPAKANALNSAMMAAFVGAFQALAGEADLRAVVIAGAGGRAFCAGADVEELASIDGPAAARAFIGEVHACCQAVRDCPVPVIAAIDGATLGAGLELAASCDLRLASDASRFGMPEVKLGIPSVVEAAILPGLIGFGAARELLLLGETIGAEQALALGLVNTVTPRVGLAAAVEAVLASLLANGATAVRLQKRLIQAWESLPLTDAIAAGVDAFAEAHQTDEPRAMIAASQAARRSGSVGS